MQTEFGFKTKSPMPIHCDNQSTIYVAQNLVFHDHTKYIEVNYHLVQDTMAKKLICIPYSFVKTISYVLTKTVPPPVFSNLCKNRIWLISMLQLEGMLDWITILCLYLVLYHLWVYLDVVGSPNIPLDI